MNTLMSRKREKFKINIKQNQDWIGLARKSFDFGDYNKSFDIYEQLYLAFPKNATQILAEAYDRYHMIIDEDRYILYQSRHYDFGIKPGDKVLDIGSGNYPFHMATHLADIAVEDNNYGRAGGPFKHIDGKPVFECDLEQMPFKDNEFDFVYSSHVLEHVINPEGACEELMRIARRGYIETPAPHKDMLLNTAKCSNHRWGVETIDDKLVFREFSQKRIEGLGSDILLNMHCAPQTAREKAFAALIFIKPEFFNTMLLWDTSFDYEVKRLEPACFATDPFKEISSTDDGDLSAKDIFRKGIACLERKDASGAIELFNRVSQHSNTIPSLNYARAVAFAQIGRFDMAQKECDLELKLRPDQMNVINFLERIEQAILAENQSVINR